MNRTFRSTTSRWSSRAGVSISYMSAPSAVDHQGREQHHAGVRDVERHAAQQPLALGELLREVAALADSDGDHHGGVEQADADQPATFARGETQATWGSI